MIIAYIITPAMLHRLGCRNIHREILKKRIRKIKANLLRADLVRIQENLFEARYHK